MRDNRPAKVAAGRLFLLVLGDLFELPVPNRAENQGDAEQRQNYDHDE